MLSDCHNNGLFMHGDPQSPVNVQIVPALRHIFAAMSRLPADHPKRVNNLTALVEACQDCQQVQAREILWIFGDLTAQNETFECQLKYSLLRAKESALNRLITKKHSKCDLDHTKVQPWQQRAHLVSGYVSLIGDQLGLEGVVAARSDRFLGQALQEIHRSRSMKPEDWLDLVKKDLSIKEWLQTLLADINNQAAAADRLINRDCIFKWVQKNMTQEAAHEVFYDEERIAEFEGQDPELPTKDNQFQPFLSCRVLVDMLLATGMLERA